MRSEDDNRQTLDADGVQTLGHGLAVAMVIAAVAAVILVVVVLTVHPPAWIATAVLVVVVVAASSISAHRATKGWRK